MLTHGPKVTYMTTNVVTIRVIDMKHFIALLTFTSLSACASLKENVETPCAAIQLNCFGSQNILIVGDPAEQGDLLNTALSSANQFQSIFGVSPAKTVIVPGGVISSEQNKAFEAAGYPISLPWLSTADKAKLKEASIRQQVEAQTKTLPEAVKAAAMAQALSAIETKPDEASESKQAGALSHELGHLWFMNAFKPAKAEKQSGHAYGGWAPDWLDETAAILMENDILIASRRDAFLSMSDEDIFPLEIFLSMEHPAAQSARRLNEMANEEKIKGASRAIILTGEEAAEFLKSSGGDKAANFYSQTQAFSDFLLSYSGDKQLYVSLTKNLLLGGTFENWLTSEGANWGLADSLVALDDAWTAWVKKQRKTSLAAPFP